MQKLISGLSQFQNSDYRHKQSLFEELAHGQSPQTLFITCSDSRIDPNLITRSDPGDLFVLRNAGNLIPRHGQASGEAATIEYAIKALRVQDIVVCGHSQCGAMNAILQTGSCDQLPAVAAWLQNADGLAQRTLQRHGEQSPERMLELVIQENVRMQLENLQALRCVADALSNDQVQLHGWAYDIGSGKVEMLDCEKDAFVPLSDAAFSEINDSTSGFA
ncbi:carbonic anhydrase [Blastopirellula sp. J2-11]|uniref:carbonic anhydrase n=1 Tax=Blastopirellula sp. J2-11 TaxID=2943192 RepID=UPI0021C8E8BD|nr:carbonic anhydrase [Blastopirellula sp. J2-11]UUO04731.1 carbonic anhydrase [Blastopirellula sp. J2-11]